MKYYAFAGVVDAEHYYGVFKAECQRDADEQFNDHVFNAIAQYYVDEGTYVLSEAREFVEDNFSAPWVVFCGKSDSPIDISRGVYE